jgi:cytochrome c biogenesis protein CcdA
MGTFLAFISYGLLGSLLIDFLKDKQSILNWVIGLALFSTGMIQFYRTFIRPQSGKEGVESIKDLEFNRY